MCKSGHRFMTDLLVWSLMADRGLDNALNEFLSVDISEIANLDETCEIGSSPLAIPLLYLVRQLIRLVLCDLPETRNTSFDCVYRNSSTMTQSALKECSSGRSGSQKPNAAPSLKLLQRFQRLLIGKGCSNYNMPFVTRRIAGKLLHNSECTESAETLLAKYLECFSKHATTTLNIAYDMCIANTKHFVYAMQALKTDLIGTFLSFYNS